MKAVWEEDEAPAEGTAAPGSATLVAGLMESVSTITRPVAASTPAELAHDDMAAWTDSKPRAVRK